MVSNSSFLIIRAFTYQSPATYGGARNRLTYTPKQIYSYDLLIGEWKTKDDRTICFLYNYTAESGNLKSRTMSRHVGQIKRALLENNIPFHFCSDVPYRVMSVECEEDVFRRDYIPNERGRVCRDY